jgi:hypothetical protein
MIQGHIFRCSPLELLAAAAPESVKDENGPFHERTLTPCSCQSGLPCMLLANICTRPLQSFTFLFNLYNVEDLGTAAS